VSVLEEGRQEIEGELARLAQVYIQAVREGKRSRDLQKLIGDIGECHAALELNGQRAAIKNQHGWDVFADGQYYSVKCRAFPRKRDGIKITMSTSELFDQMVIYELRIIEDEVYFYKIGYKSLLEVQSSDVRRDQKKLVYEVKLGQYWKMPEYQEFCSGVPGTLRN
jgi:hypothetical protein